MPVPDASQYISKGFSMLGLSQYGCGGEKLFQSEKRLFTFLTPFELGIFL
jgi:hypothetical protein